MKPAAWNLGNKVCPKKAMKQTPTNSLTQGFQLYYSLQTTDMDI